MDLPPSGWYPDPYGTPDLLRWWDGLNWTRHTHPGVGGGVADTGGGGGAAVGEASGNGTAGNGTSGGGALGGGRRGPVEATTVQQATGQSGSGQLGGGWGARDRVIGDWAGTDWPTGEQLATTKPPKGPRTEAGGPGPAGHLGPGVGAIFGPGDQVPAGRAGDDVPGGRAAERRRADRRAGAGAADGRRRVGGHVGAAQRRAAEPQAANGGVGADGTQVLFLGGDAWQVPGGPDGQANRYGYQEAQRRGRTMADRRDQRGHGGRDRDHRGRRQQHGRLPREHGGGPDPGLDPAFPTAPASLAASPSVAASPTASVTPPASVLSDGQSGLSYSPLRQSLDGGLPDRPGRRVPVDRGRVRDRRADQRRADHLWTARRARGRCPAQYNYTGASDLENTATNVASTLGNAYYTALAHTSAPVLSQPVSVSGHPGWEIEYQLTYTNAAAQAPPGRPRRARWWWRTPAPGTPRWCSSRRSRTRSGRRR